MDLNTYQQETRKTAVYPPHEQKGYYPILALCGEVGELANVYKKWLRGDYEGRTSDEIKASFDAKIMDELGDVMWYVARVAEDFGFTLNEVAKFNLKKLRLRKATGRLKSR